MGEQRKHCTKKKTKRKIVSKNNVVIQAIKMNEKEKGRRCRFP